MSADREEMVSKSYADAWERQWRQMADWAKEYADKMRAAEAEIVRLEGEVEKAVDLFLPESQRADAAEAERDALRADLEEAETQRDDSYGAEARLLARLTEAEGLLAERTHTFLAPGRRPV